MLRGTALVGSLQLLVGLLLAPVGMLVLMVE
jgi:hypothetical protein